MKLQKLDPLQTKGNNTARANARKTQAPPQKRHTLLIIVLIAAFICSAAVVTLLLLYSGIHIQYVMELGDPLPEADVFSAGDVSVAYITDISALDTSVTGSHWIHISANGNDRLVNFMIRDTVAPTAEPVDMMISVGQQVTPDQLVSSLTDADVVMLQWDAPPEFGTVGDYPVVISMKDMSGNTSSVTSMVRIRAVVESVSYEAGTALPALTDFLVDAGLNAAFITDLGALPLDTPGEYGVDMRVNGTDYTSKLIVIDTIAPRITVKTVFVQTGGSASPEDFVESAEDATALSYAFDDQPLFDRIGAQDISIVVRDLGGNTVRENALLLVSDVAPITVEARDTALKPEEFVIKRGIAAVSMRSALVPDMPGDHIVELSLDGVIHPTIATVVDTVPPKGESVALQWYLDNPLTPDRFVKNAFDYTGITYTYTAEPDWAKSGAQDVSVVLTDAAGNTTTVTSTLKLTADTEPPSLYGVKDRYWYIGQPVAYFAEVFAEDNCDENVAITVDNVNVDIHKAGTYKVTYTATDSAGNSVTQSCKFTFIEEKVTDEQLFEAADKVLAKIISGDMPVGRQVYAIFRYVHDHIGYSGSTNNSDWKYEAYRGLTKRRGDCYTYYATAKCLLERIGVQTMSVERSGGGMGTKHYWLLVNAGTGWYHFDAIRREIRADFVCFMKTDKELVRGGRSFYSFNKSLYPPTPTESFKLD